MIVALLRTLTITNAFNFSHSDIASSLWQSHRHRLNYRLRPVHSHRHRLRRLVGIEGMGMGMGVHIDFDIGNCHGYSA
jgi:hypothetical protein